MIIPDNLTLEEYIGAVKAQESTLLSEGKDAILVSSTLTMLEVIKRALDTKQDKEQK